MRTLISISGGGSFARLARDHHDGLLESDIEIVADRPGREDVADHVIPRRGNPDYFDQFLALADGYDVVMLTSNWILPDRVVEALRGRLLNQHPSLLPGFKGLNVWDEITAAGVRFSGSTIHFVAAEVDAGPILCQTVFPITPEDTAQDLPRKHWLAARPAFVQALRWMEQSRVQIDWGNHRVTVTGAQHDWAPTIPNVEFDPARLPTSI